MGEVRGEGLCCAAAVNVDCTDSDDELKRKEHSQGICTPTHSRLCVAPEHCNSVDAGGSTEVQVHSDTVMYQRTLTFITTLIT